jgi:hypothetical protein
MKRGELWLLLSILALITALTFPVIHEESSRSLDAAPYSSLSVERHGVAALYAFAVATGRPTRLLTESLDRPGLLASPGLMFLIQPLAPAPPAQPGVTTPKTSEILTDSECAALLSWVARGGTLVLATRSETRLHRDLDLRLFESERAQSDAFARPVAPIRLAASGRLEMLDDVVLSSQSPAWVALHRGLGGVYSALRSYQAGRVVSLSTPAPATNRGLRSAGNAAFFTRLIADTEGPIYFDEYHHGFVRESDLMWYLRQRSLLAFVAQALLAFAFMCWSLAPSLARPRTDDAPCGIESREFLSGLANIYARAGLQGHPIAWFERGLLQALRLLINEPSLPSLEAAPSERVAARLKELGHLHYRGFEAHMKLRASLASKAGVATPIGQAIDWEGARGLHPDELRGLIASIRRLERQWLELLDVDRGLDPKARALFERATTPKDDSRAATPDTAARRGSAGPDALRSNI